MNLPDRLTKLSNGALSPDEVMEELMQAAMGVIEDCKYTDPVMRSAHKTAIERLLIELHLKEDWDTEQSINRALNEMELIKSGKLKGFTFDELWNDK